MKRTSVFFSLLLCVLAAALLLSACGKSVGETTGSFTEAATNPATEKPTSENDSAGDADEPASEGEDFIEKEQPELSEESKQKIAAYQKNPTLENYLDLRESVISNYNAVLRHKESKLAELRVETAGRPNGEAVVAEMDEIVQDMYLTYWEHINASMLRFTDRRLLRWRIADAPGYDYIPVMGAGETIFIKRTPVTNAEYAQFLAATGHPAPENWTGGSYPAGEGDFPVNFVSYADAEVYCEWLTAKDGTNSYRLPSESEWELAAGHMPKDADFNCQITNGRVPVTTYEGVTRGAHGAIDFWGNVWEWTSTGNGSSLRVKGGSFRSQRTECRTEYRKESRDATLGYDDVGFRVIQVQNGVEPAQSVDLAGLPAPVLTVEQTGEDSAILCWTPVVGAVGYQIFAYDEETKLFRMLADSKETTFSVAGEISLPTTGFVVQAISYTGFSDNVCAESIVKATGNGR